MHQNTKNNFYQQSRNQNKIHKSVISMIYANLKPLF